MNYCAYFRVFSSVQIHFGSMTNGWCPAVKIFCLFWVWHSLPFWLDPFILPFFFFNIFQWLNCVTPFSCFDPYRPVPIHFSLFRQNLKWINVRVPPHNQVDRWFRQPNYVLSMQKGLKVDIVKLVSDQFRKSHMIWLTHNLNLFSLTGPHETQLYNYYYALGIKRIRLL
jgi:hypothetical protein